MTQPHRRPVRLGLAAWATTLVLVAGSVAMLFVNAVVWRQAGWSAFLVEAAPPLVGALTYGSFGALLVVRQPSNRVGWLLLWFGFVFGLTMLASGITLYAFGPGSTPGTRAVPGALLAAWLQNWSFGLEFPVGFGVLLLLFPDGRPPSPRWRAVLGAAVGVISTLILGGILIAGRLTLQFGPGTDGSRPYEIPVDNPTGVLPHGFAVLGDVVWLLGLAVVLACGASLVVRFRHAPAVQRQQIKWLAYVGGAEVLGGLSTLVPVRGAFAGTFGLLSNLAFYLMVTAIIVGVPIAVAVSVLRYRLYDIDVVINRTLVYGVLTAFVGSVYVLIVVGLGHLLSGSGRPSLALSIAATAVVAIAFQPVRERVQRVVNQLVYGRRATPYEVLAGFSHRMAATLSVEELLPRMAEAAARGVGGSQALVRLTLSQGERTAAWPEGSLITGPAHRVAVTSGGEELGEVRLVKTGGAQLSGTETALIRVLATQAAPVFRNIRLTLELQARLEEISSQAQELRASRGRIVAAADSQRRRIEAEIRDTTEPQLLEIATELEQAERLLAADPASAAPRLEALNAQTNRVLNQLREMARGIFPPLLADRGAVVALEAYARKLEAPVTIEVPEALRASRFTPEVEATIYYCCVEALRGAGGEVSLRLELIDDGVAFRVDGYGRGAGLTEMADRIAAVGGALEVDHGTLSANVPARALQAVA